MSIVGSKMKEEHMEVRAKPQEPSFIQLRLVYRMIRNNASVESENGIETSFAFPFAQIVPMTVPTSVSTNSLLAMPYQPER
jgi:hypothetical protein